MHGVLFLNCQLKRFCFHWQKGYELFFFKKIVELSCEQLSKYIFFNELLFNGVFLYASVCGFGDLIALHFVLFICSLVLIIRVYSCFLKQERDKEVGEKEEAPASLLQKLRTTATKLFQLNQAIRRLHSCLSTALRGEASDVKKHSLDVTLKP